MIRRSRRDLRPEERKLWSEVARSVSPLDPSKALAATPEEEPARPRPDEVEAGREPAPPPPSPAPARRPAATPPLVPLEQRTRRALSRGRQGVDATLDLHGMRQEEAHGALCAFLRRSQATGCTLVLVVTGKGGSASEFPSYDGSGRGVLRRSVPLWLRAPELRNVVGGFEEAVRHHGGEGALYVRIRRNRAGA